ncbi:MAG: protein kinase domain-containing protein [Polyangiales bacterium]
MTNEDDTTVPARRRAQTTTRTPVFVPGDVLDGNYEILRVIGEGGMGQVFEAKDRALERRVAIKVGWPNRDPAALRMEARALSALRHPSMVTVHHLARHQSTEFVVMERVYGVSLSTHIARRRAANQPFTIGEVIHVASALADGLAIVHGAGLAHRDVKPANVMIAPKERVVLMDFGLSQAEADTAPASAPSGTPDYMAPEAIMNDSRIGGRHMVDLYALGVIAYEMLTLQTPFPGNSIVEVWSGHLAVEPKDVRELRADVPPQLAELVTRMMAKTPDERPESMESVAIALRSMRGSHPEVKTESTSILVVDDDPDFTQLLRTLLRKLAPSAAVVTAHDAEHAIAKMHERAPALLLLDLRMPGMNGLELAMYLRGTHLADTTTIVSVSALAGEDDVALLRLLGITDFVSKGPDLEQRLGQVLSDVDRRRVHGV